MIMRLKWLNYLLTITIILLGPIGMLNSAYAQEPEEFLAWQIATSKQAFYPGEPALLTLNIKNTGTQEEEIDFGSDGIGAFSMEIRDSNGVIVAKGEKIQRWGITAGSPFFTIHPNEISQKLIVLNRWGSTLLPVGKYHVICNIEYRLRSESQEQSDTIVVKAGLIHKMQLGLDIQIIELDRPKFKKILETLAGCEVKPEAQGKKEWLASRDIAREMLTFTESDLAITYQLQLLKVERSTWRKCDIINSLVRSGTPEAAGGLMQMIEDPSVYKEDIKQNIIDAIYRLRETGKPELVNATEKFVTKYKRPVLLKPID